MKLADVFLPEFSLILRRRFPVYLSKLHLAFVLCFCWKLLKVGEAQSNCWLALITFYWLRFSLTSISAKRSGPTSRRTTRRTSKLTSVRGINIKPCVDDSWPRFVLKVRRERRGGWRRLRCWLLCRERHEPLICVCRRDTWKCLTEGEVSVLWHREELWVKVSHNITAPTRRFRCNTETHIRTVAQNRGVSWSQPPLQLS